VARHRSGISARSPPWRALRLAGGQSPRSLVSTVRAVLEPFLRRPVTVAQTLTVPYCLALYPSDHCVIATEKRLVAVRVDLDCTSQAGPPPRLAGPAAVSQPCSACPAEPTDLLLAYEYDGRSFPGRD
jgi:hypothetical protein